MPSDDSQPILFSKIASQRIKTKPGTVVVSLAYLHIWTLKKDPILPSASWDPSTICIIEHTGQLNIINEHTLLMTAIYMFLTTIYTILGQSYVILANQQPACGGYILYSEDCVMLQKDQDKLLECQDKWRMIFHPQKCKALSMTCTRRPVRHIYHIRERELENVSHAAYLGAKLMTN